MDFRTFLFLVLLTFTTPLLVWGQQPVNGTITVKNGEVIFTGDVNCTELGANFTTEPWIVNARVVTFRGNPGSNHKWYANNILISRDQEFSHTFPASGEYIITHEMWNPFCEPVSSTQVISVGNICDPINAQIFVIKDGENVFLSATDVSGSVTNLEWYLPNNQVKTTPAVVYKHGKTGTFDVHLVAYSECDQKVVTKTISFVQPAECQNIVFDTIYLPPPLTECVYNGITVWEGIQYQSGDSGCEDLLKLAPPVFSRPTHIDWITPGVEQGPIKWLSMSQAGTYVAKLLATDIETRQQTLYCFEFTKDCDGFTTDTDEVEENFMVNVFPNPTTSSITIDIPDSGVYKMKIFDSSGQILEESMIRDKTEFDANDLPSGTYHINLVDEDGITESRHFVKIEN